MTLQTDKGRKRAGRPRLSRENRKRQIVRAAGRMFAEQGYPQTTMDQVAERCGISKPLVYGYFGSKDGLYLAAVEQAQEELRQIIERTFETGGPRADPLLWALVSYFEFMEARPHFLAALVRDSRLLPPAALKAVDSLRRAQEDMIRPLLRAVAPDLPAKLLTVYAEIVLGGCERLAWRRLAHPDIPAATTARHMTVFIRSGLEALVEPTPPSPPVPNGAVMSEISRRSVLAGAAGAAGLAAVAGVPRARATAHARVPVTRSEERVVIIGSGFGGGVTALRFAQAGVRCLVLERGIWWPTGPNAETFPHPSSPDKRMFWLGSTPQIFGISADPFEHYTGLLEQVPGNGMDMIVAAGVGGGSLVYQGMTLQPAENVFNANLPEQLDYARMAKVHYPRVAKMLQIETAPDELINSPTYKPARIFAQDVRRAGYDLTKIPMPIDWTYALRELKGEMKPSYTNGDCALGVNNGGKHSVDVTYIAAARATGLVTVATQHNVTDVLKAKDGRWEIHVDRIDTGGTVLEKKIITARALVMAAGTAGTTKLLMRASAKGQIPDMPDGLGAGWGSNGDRIYLWTNLEDDFGYPQGGPVVYGSFEWDDAGLANTVIQASLPPIGGDIRSTMIVGYGVSKGRGRFTYDAAKDDAVLQWSKGADDTLYHRIDARVHKIAGPSSVLTDTTGAYPSTWHPLGGASMGVVCDLAGRVQGQRGLYVLDGALLPGTAAACNPSMTIAAVAERATDELVAKDVEVVF
ncbi:TetR family transcriptional regulator [Actinomadura nitritigenes]|uniref:TetR family transcriptional regulator n=1 Tax=Actinomadura nitritigenes TaxID=134602 RepID=UPI003D8EF705